MAQSNRKSPAPARPNIPRAAQSDPVGGNVGGGKVSPVFGVLADLSTANANCFDSLDELEAALDNVLSPPAPATDTEPRELEHSALHGALLTERDRARYINARLQRLITRLTV